MQPQNKKFKGTPTAGLHSDQNWWAAPFPEHNQILTGCVVASDDCKRHFSCSLPPLALPLCSFLHHVPNHALCTRPADTLENGATCLVPGSHKLRRHPNKAEQDNCAHIVMPVSAKRGDIVVSLLCIVEACAAYHCCRIAIPGSWTGSHRYIVHVRTLCCTVLCLWWCRSGTARSGTRLA